MKVKEKWLFPVLKRREKKVGSAPPLLFLTREGCDQKQGEEFWLSEIRRRRSLSHPFVCLFQLTIQSLKMQDTL